MEKTAVTFDSRILSEKSDSFVMGKENKVIYYDDAEEIIGMIAEIGEDDIEEDDDYKPMTANEVWEAFLKLSKSIIKTLLYKRRLVILQKLYGQLSSTKFAYIADMRYNIYGIDFHRILPGCRSPPRMKMNINNNFIAASARIIKLQCKGPAMCYLCAGPKFILYIVL